MSFPKKNSKQLKKANVLTLLIYFILIGVFVFSLWQVISYFSEGKRESDFNQSLIESAVSEVEPRGDKNFEGGELVSPFTGYDPNSSTLLFYPDIEVDMQKLKKQYPKIVGWLYSPETPINYPVMQGEDNAYFVDKLPNGDANSAGSLFLDYRDDPDLMDFNHVIYGHNMKNNSMFGTVLDYRKEGYFEEHPYLFYFTENATYRLELFAGVNTLATSDVFTKPNTEEEFEEYLNFALNNSTFSSQVSVTSQDRIILLSTCSGAVNQPNRYVLFAKLVKLD